MPLPTLSPTYAQLGDAAQPDAHTATQTPDGRDAVPVDPRPEDAPGLGRFAWRLTGQYTRPDNRAAADGAAGTSTVAEHASVGEPDRRRQYDALTPAGYPRALPRVSNPEQFRSEDHGAVSIAAPVQLTVNKAGSTSADLAREAGVPRALYDRPFDQNIAHHPLTVSKLERPSPLASLPMSQTVATGGAIPSPGGMDGITRQDTTMGTHRNTIRMVPTPWDESAVVGTSVQPVAGRRWKL